MMKPIKVYPSYVVNDQGKVFGLNGNAREVIVLKDEDDKIHSFKDFFVVGGTIYFSVAIMENGPEEIPDSDPVAYEQIPADHHYQQTGETVAEVSELPVKTISERVEMGVSPFSIVSGKSGDYDISNISQDVPSGKLDENKKEIIDHINVNFLNINGYHATNKGMWFSVPEGIEKTAIKRGLYFWVIGSGRIGNCVEYCRVWVK